MMNSTTTSIDTNVIVYLLNQDNALNERALAAIERSRKAGNLVVSGPVYAELLGLPSRTQAILDEFFTTGGVQIDWRLEEAVWRTAGMAFQGYVTRRVADNKGFPRRILADFLVGAHTLIRGYTLLTVDKGLYEISFPGIQVRSI
jgi:predicted nucleic acid-binding protein